MKARVDWSSERTLRIELDHADGLAGERVREVLAALRRAALPRLADACAAYATIQLTFGSCERLGDRDPSSREDADTLERVRRVVEHVLDTPPRKPVSRPCVVIPVCYEGECAPDLGDVAARAGMTPREVIEAHAGRQYCAEFLGFMPGFAYLSGLDERLASPRLATPRPRVPPGSVAIGGSQTAVYPVASPGGWRIIGRTPLRMFDATREVPSVLSGGNQVRFVPISKEEFDLAARDMR